MAVVSVVVVDDNECVFVRSFGVWFCRDRIGIGRGVPKRPRRIYIRGRAETLLSVHVDERRYLSPPVVSYTVGMCAGDSMGAR